ncbi:MAG: acyl carrier protein [Chloroflexota bacterium]|nr:acyl carrier protein [Chloroflexota bacterium]
MATTEERLRKLVDDNLDIEGRAAGEPLHMDYSLRESGVSSVDFVAFAKIVADEFGVTFNPEDCAKYNTVGELITRLES